MKCFCVLCAFLWLTPLSGNAEIIDRIVAVVESRIITLSDMRQEREVRARLGEKPVDDDKTLLKQMIDNHLVEAQIADFPGVEATEAEIDADLARSSDASPVIREAVRRRIRTARYFDVRFRQFIRPSEEDVRKYYDNVFVPAAKARGLNPIPRLEQVADGIRRNVIEENLEHDVNIWLEAIRRRSHIEVFD
jgi:hypothetical protein